MSVQNPQDLFVWMLSDVRKREERSKQLYQELSQNAQDPDVKDILDAWVYLEGNVVSTLDKCFSMIGKQPVQTETRLHEVFIEDFRKELNTIQNPVAKALFVAHKASTLMHIHIGEYVALTAMADITGKYGLGALLESCLADNVAFAERVRRRISNIIQSQTAGMQKAA